MNRLIRHAAAAAACAIASAPALAHRPATSLAEASFYCEGGSQLQDQQFWAKNPTRHWSIGMSDCSLVGTSQSTGRVSGLAMATKTPNGFGGFMPGLMDGDMYVVDVLTIHVPGAAPGKVTTLHLNSKMPGQLSVDPGNANGQASASYAACLGAQDDASCAPSPAWVVTDAQLPAPSGMVATVAVSAGRSWTAADLVFQPYALATRTEIQVVGPTAVIPYILRVHKYVTADGGVLDYTPASATGDFRWNLYLPQGVSCTSRSGHAFEDLCPAGTD